MQKRKQLSQIPTILAAIAIMLGFLPHSQAATSEQAFSYHWSAAFGAYLPDYAIGWDYRPYSTFSSSAGRLDRIEVEFAISASNLTPGDTLAIRAGFFTGGGSHWQSIVGNSYPCDATEMTVAQLFSISDPVELARWVDPPNPETGFVYFETRTRGGNHTISAVVSLKFHYTNAIIAHADIKPGSYPNRINLKSNGVIPVAILTTATASGEAVDFDANSIDVPTAIFGPAGARDAHGKGHLEDVDADGDLDLVLHFRTQETGLTAADTVAVLKAKTHRGEDVTCYDTVVCR